uniref:RxLR effector candidate protein n=1 Tax=Hyaloperonospora arabidopsidis (strain Emoy2) TaxID=559515 RepID=M4BVZ7_HYAAE
MGRVFVLFALSLCVLLLVATGPALAHVDSKDAFPVANGLEVAADHTSNEVHPSVEVTTEERAVSSMHLEPEVVQLLPMSSEQAKLFDLIRSSTNLDSAYAKLKPNIPKITAIRGHNALRKARSFFVSDHLSAYHRFAQEIHGKHADAEAIKDLELHYGSKVLALSLCQARMWRKGPAHKAAVALEDAQFEKWLAGGRNPGDIIKVKLGVEDPDKLEGLEKLVKDGLDRYVEKKEKTQNDAKLLQ